MSGWSRWLILDVPKIIDSTNDLKNFRPNPLCFDEESAEYGLQKAFSKDTIKKAIMRRERGNK